MRAKNLKNMETRLISRAIAFAFISVTALMCIAGDSEILTGKTRVLAKEHERPVLALIPVGDDDLVLLMASIVEPLSQDGSYLLVEREHIDLVLKEQELMALSSASSVSKRMELGRVLGADLLVFITKHSSPRPYVEIVISETSRGLRLQVSKLSLSDGPVETAKVILV